MASTSASGSKACGACKVRKKACVRGECPYAELFPTNTAWKYFILWKVKKMDKVKDILKRPAKERSKALRPEFEQAFQEFQDPKYKEFFEDYGKLGGPVFKMVPLLEAVDVIEATKEKTVEELDKEFHEKKNLISHEKKKDSDCSEVVEEWKEFKRNIDNFLADNRKELAAKQQEVVDKQQEVAILQKTIADVEVLRGKIIQEISQAQHVRTSKMKGALEAVNVLDEAMDSAVGKKRKAPASPNLVERRVAKTAAIQKAVAAPSASAPHYSAAASSASAHPYVTHSLQSEHFNRLKFKPSFSVHAAVPVANNLVVTLLDYKAGSLRSVRNAIRYLGYDIKDVQAPEDILNAERLIFPGVGAFAPAMDVLNKKELAEALCAYIKQDRPFLGIGLGLQLLFESSEENGPVKGLGLIPGVVGRFDSSNGCRVPHTGWNAIKIKKDSQILDDIGNRHVYFVHSHRAIPSDDNEDWISSTSNYGSDFIASVRRGNVHAVQFNPEKSGEVGLSVLRRFLNPKSEIPKVPVQWKASKLAKRVIACLDVRTNDEGDLIVTKGDQYDARECTDENEVRNLGKPVDLAGQYYKDGADEVSFLNITGFRDFPLGDLPMLQVLRHASENIFVPLTVGGGIRDFTDGNGRYYSSLEVASEYFRSGADKVSIGSDAVYAAEEYLKTKVKTGKSSIEQISRVYGNQAVVVSIDPRRVYLKDPNDVEFKSVKVSKPGPNGEEFAWYQCTVNSGRPIGAYELAKVVEELGAGEILLTCVDCDGQGEGFDIDIIKLISDAVSIPVIASSGAGAVEHFSEVFSKTNASAALAAGVFHRKEVTIRSVKEHLLKEDIEVRV